MKKLLLFFAMVLCSLTTWADDVNLVTAKLSSTAISVTLENTTEFVAFQMDITVPTEDLPTTPSAAAGARLLVQGNPASVSINGKSESTDFIVSYNVISTTTSTTTLRVVAYNLGNNPILGEQGDEIVSIPLEAKPDTDEVTLSTVIFVRSSDLAEITVGTKTEDGILYGDVNMDGKWDILDVAGVITIMKGLDTTGLNVPAADVNQDGVTNILDIAGILEIIKNSK